MSDPAIPFRKCFRLPSSLLFFISQVSQVMYFCSRFCHFSSSNPLSFKSRLFNKHPNHQLGERPILQSLSLVRHKRIHLWLSKPMKPLYLFEAVLKCLEELRKEMPTPDERPWARLLVLFTLTRYDCLLLVSGIKRSSLLLRFDTWLRLTLKCLNKEERRNLLSRGKILSLYLLKFVSLLANPSNPWKQIETNTEEKSLALGFAPLRPRLVFYHLDLNGSQIGRLLSLLY